MATRKFVVPEKNIELAILNYLAWKNIFAFKVENGGVYSANLKKFRFDSNRRIRGVADIIGIYRGKPMALEVKSDVGRLRPEQKVFLQQWKAEGGICAVVRSVEDVETFLEWAK